MIKKDPNDIIIVNFTTWPLRDMYVPKMLSIFCNQTLKYDKIILWLSKEEYPDVKKLPPYILKCVENKLISEIRMVKGNTGPHKRWEVFKYYNYAYNIFIDDDVIYPNTFVEELYKTSKKYKTPTCYFARTVDFIGTNRKEITFKNLSIKNELFSGLSCFPPFTFPIESFKYYKLRDTYVFKCDDSWINAWLKKKNIKIYAIHHFEGTLNSIDNTQNVSIWKTYNMLKNENKVTYRIVNIYNAAKILKCDKEYKTIWPKIDLDDGADLSGISICMTAYNSKDYIKEALDSIISQSWFKYHNSWEIIIGIDHDEELLKYMYSITKYYKNLRVVYMDSNEGTYITSNTIFKLAKYENILRFDSDDIMDEHMISTIMPYMKTYDMCRYKFKYMRDGYVPTWNAFGSICIKKSVFNRFGGYRNWRVSADKELYERISKFIDVKCLDVPLYLYRTTTNNLTHSSTTGLNSSYRKKLHDFIANNTYENDFDAIIHCQVNTYKILKSPLNYDKSKYQRTCSPRSVEEYSFDPKKFNIYNAKHNEIKHIKTAVLSKPATTQENTNRSFYNPYSRSVKTINTSALKNNRRYESSIKLLN